MTPFTTVRRRQQGVTLIELMIALVLGLVITAGIYQLFSVTQRTYRLEQAMADVQENGRFMISVFQRELRHAGFPPACQGESGPEESLMLNLTSDTKDSLFPNGRFDAVGGWKDRSSMDSYTDQILSGDYQTGNILLIHHAANSADLTLNEEIKSEDVEADVAGGKNLVNGDIFAFVFQDRCEVVETTENGKLRPPNPFDKNFPGNTKAEKQNKKDKKDEKDVKDENITWIGVPIGDLYYIGWDNPREEPGLRRLDLASGKSETLASPVVDLRLRYLVAGGDKYQLASDVNSWDDIMAVRVSLLLRSPTPNVLESPAHVQMGDIDFTASDDDRRLYQGFTTTVALRNTVVGEK